MLTYDAVVAAIGTIRARGQRPSLNVILHETGGSKTDISRHFKRWRAEQAARDVAPPPPEVAALEALSPDLASRIRNAYEDRSRAELSKAHEELVFAQQHIVDLERALSDADTVQTHLRTELNDRATSEQRLADAMAGQQQAFLDALKAMQHDMHAAIGSLESRCADLADGITQVRDAIAGVQTDAREQAAALSRSAGEALEQQRTAFLDQCAGNRAAILQSLQVRHLATIRAVRSELGRSLDRANLVARNSGTLVQRIVRRRPLAYVQAPDAVRGRDGLAQAMAIPPGISQDMDDVRASIGRGIAQNLATQAPLSTDL